MSASLFSSEENGYTDVLDRAIFLWGKMSQIQMAYGECGEFVTLAGRRMQGRAGDEDFVDEIADNLIMMAQMRRIFGTDAVDKRVAHKMARLHAREEAFSKLESEKRILTHDYPEHPKEIK